ncbi:PIG-L family deacetylase [Kytococcus sedentarius]|uniref:PIG-L family deacetylase n=1 Tax=Kytococcus sedentarius TaxID=1276 RepID=UPI0035BC4BD3
MTPTAPRRAGSPSRRTVLSGMVGAGVTLGACAPRGTIVVVSPHPDDETLRLAGYVLHARDRGDRLVLVAVTRGAASGARPASWSTDRLTRVRTAEQEAAWLALTGGLGEVRHLDLPDGELTDDAVRLALRPVLEPLGDAVVASASHHEDEHADHRVVARVVGDLAGRRARWGLPPGAEGGARWDCPDPEAARRADEAYSPFGHSSVRRLFEDLRAADYASAVVT